MIPLTVVVFGATGDLFRKKLARVFFDIYTNHLDTKEFRIVGLSRKMLSHGQFRQLAQDAIGEIAEPEQIENFLQSIFYYSIDATDEFALKDLRDILDKLDQGFGMCSNKLYYIATVPETYESIFQNISNTGLSIPCAATSKDKNAWIRIIVEKPFGSNSESAGKLDSLLGTCFKEEQIYRIDHYLAKETVQAIEAFRFDNPLFTDIWNKDHIKKIHIFAYEDEKKDTIESRKTFYDSVGALNDFGQNHLLEILSLIAMKKPKDGTPESVRRERARVLSATHFTKDSNLVIGQYDGYRTEGFKESNTETYFRAELFVDVPEWQEVSFVIEHGKMLKETKTAVIVELESELGENCIEFKIQPEAEICAQVVIHGEKKNMCFDLGKKENQFIYPYQKLILDAIRGDQTLFVSTDEVKEEWRIAEEIRQQFAHTTLQVYKKGYKPL